MCKLSAILSALGLSTNTANYSNHCCACASRVWIYSTHILLYSTLYIARCEYGDLRIQGRELHGPLEVCIGSRWATVCRGGLSDVGATVACRELGYFTGT